MAKDWKERLGTVYSTNPDFEFEFDQEEEKETVTPKDQNLEVILDKKKRKGKTVTLIKGFIGTDEELKSLSKTLKIKCGVGGSEKNNEIIIQGNFQNKIIDILNSMGYNTK